MEDSIKSFNKRFPLMRRLKGAEAAPLKQAGKFFRFFVCLFVCFCCLRQRWFTFCCRESKIREA